MTWRLEQAGDSEIVSNPSIGASPLASALRSSFRLGRWTCREGAWWRRAWRYWVASRLWSNKRGSVSAFCGVAASRFSCRSGTRSCCRSTEWSPGRERSNACWNLAWCDFAWKPRLDRGVVPNRLFLTDSWSPQTILCTDETERWTLFYESRAEKWRKNRSNDVITAQMTAQIVKKAVKPHTIGQYTSSFVASLVHVYKLGQ